MPMTALDALFKERFHGAVNIRGIRYQLLYALLRSLEIYDETASTMSIQLEGIEDLDIIGPEVADRYIQIKTAEKPWSWGQLGDPLAGFLQVMRRQSTGHFELIVDFSLRGPIAQLARYADLPTSEQQAIRQRFVTLCLNLHTTTKKINTKARCTPQEAQQLLDHLTIVSRPEPDVIVDLRRRITIMFELGSDIVDVYLLVLIGSFLEWAKDRQQVTRERLEHVRLDTGTALVQESAFQATGRGLIHLVVWDEDGRPDDFLEGKGTRAGHITQTLDVVRTTWLHRIDQALHGTGICVLRASSGQGKSTLLYRYAHDYWNPNTVLQVRVVETAEHVEQIRQHLLFRTRLQIPQLVVIDGAGWQTKCWPQLAQHCASLGVRLLVSVRAEDWYRFGQESLTGCEVLEPTLDHEEARLIFTRLQRQHRIHATVPSPDWAYERIGEPHLLMEFVYLLTHGYMLEARLRDQMQAFTRLDEDPQKRELLRRVALADTLGVPVQLQPLMTSLQLTDDPQNVLRSLDGEYVQIRDDRVSGLHWVRSQHLVNLLHEAYPTLTQTALAVFPAIPTDAVTAFLSGALAHPNIDAATLLSALPALTQTNNLAFRFQVVDGLFAGGEYQYAQAIAPYLDEAYALLGNAGEMLLSTSLMPIVQTDAILRLADQQPENATMQELARLTRAAQQHITERGRDMVRNYLTTTPPPRITTTSCDPADLGRFFDWHGVCGIRLEEDDLLEALRERLTTHDMSIDDWAVGCLGWYRVAPEHMMTWFHAHETTILSYLQEQTTALSLRIGDTTLTATFFLDFETTSDVHAEVMRRLHLLRVAVPFCDRYQSQALWCLPFDLVPSHDQTHKDIPKDNLHFPSDIDKNQVWSRTISARHRPDSFYRHQQGWSILRTEALAFLNALQRIAEQTLRGKISDIYGIVEGSGLRARVTEALRVLPDPPSQMSTDDQQAFQQVGQRWTSHFNNVFQQFLRFCTEQHTEDLRRLIVHNAKELLQILPSFHAMFTDLFRHAPDYFEMKMMERTERQHYLACVERLELWLRPPTGDPVRDLHTALAEQRATERRAIREQIEQAVLPIQQAGSMVITPTDVYEEYPLRCVALGFSVSHPAFPERELPMLLEALASVATPGLIYCLVPLVHGTPYLAGGFRIAHWQLQQWLQGTSPDWETLIPRPLPPAEMQYLSLLPRREIPWLTVVQDLMMLMGQATTQLALWQQVTSLPEDNPWLCRLRERVQQVISHHMHIVAAAVPALQARLGIIFAQTTDPAALALVQDTLRSLIMPLTPNSVPEIPPIEEMAQVVQHLYET